MSKRMTSILFLVVFTAFLTAPLVAVLVDDSTDVSYFYSISEEEEKVREVKVFQFTELRETRDEHHLKKEMNKVYVIKKYAKPHLNVISPPPDVSIL